jgi:hypothetical protein
MKLTAARWNEIHDEKGYCIATVTSSPDMEKHQQKIIAAFNNTYGKGINPEGVERMYKILEGINAFLKLTPRVTLERETPLHKEIEEALTSANYKHEK